MWSVPKQRKRCHLVAVVCANIVVGLDTGKKRKESKQRKEKKAHKR
jgi:hypothetical protein